MKRKILDIFVAAILLVSCTVAYAETTVQVWECSLNDGNTREELASVSSAWTKAAKSQAGGKGIQVFLEYPLVATGGANAFNFVMIVPSVAEWGTFNEDYADSAAEEADGPWNQVASCSKSSLYTSVDVN
jgi:hypothetical protein